MLTVHKCCCVLQEKLFLTEENVMSVISRPDEGPWCSSLEEAVHPCSCMLKAMHNTCVHVQASI